MQKQSLKNWREKTLWQKRIRKRFHSYVTQSGYYGRKFVMDTDGGMVGINVGIPVPTAYYPFSGNKESFFGDLHVLGRDGYRFFTRAKTVTTHWFDEEAASVKVRTWEGSTEQ